MSDISWVYRSDILKKVEQLGNLSLSPCVYSFECQALGVSDALAI
jgi:hypothetical protein